MKLNLWHSSFFRKSLAIAILISTVPAIVVGLFVYLFGTHYFEQEVNRSHRQELANAAERIDSQLEHLEMLATLWAFNSSFSSPLQNIDLHRDAGFVQNIYGSLTIIKSSDPLIEEVYLYLEKDDAIISDTYGIERLQADELIPYENLLSIPSSIYWTDSLPSEQANVLPYSLIIRLNKGLDRSNSFMVFRMKADALHRLIDGTVADPNGSTLLLKENGDLISAGRVPIDSLTSLDAALQQRVALLPSDAGTFLEQWDGERYSVTYHRMSRIGTSWTLASATPVSALTAPVVTMSRTIIGISAAMLAVGFWLSWIASRNMYKPIQRLVNLFSHRRGNDTSSDEFEWIASEWNNVSRKSEDLQRRLRTQLPSLREGFLLQLMQGHLYSLSGQELLGRMETYGWAVHNRQWVLMVVQLHGLFHKEGKFAPGDEQLVTFAAANIAVEWSRGRGDEVEADVVNFHNLTLGLLISYPDSSAAFEKKAEWHRVAEGLASTLHQFLKLDVTVGVSRPLHSIEGIPTLLDDAFEALKRRQVRESMQVIDIEDLVPHGDHEPAYPSEEEKGLLQALRMGLHEVEVDQLIDRFYNRLQSQSANELHLRNGFYQLFNMIQYTIVQSGFNPLELYGGVILNERLAELREPESIVEWIKRDVVRPFLSELQLTQNLHIKQLVESVLETIHQDYMKDISLESCADLHGTYPRKLSLGFKQITGENFIDYLTNYRLDKARDLLHNTDDKINDIAEKVGYQPAYFHRLFKKHAGITPGKYRELRQQ